MYYHKKYLKMGKLEAKKKIGIDYESYMFRPGNKNSEGNLLINYLIRLLSQSIKNLILYNYKLIYILIYNEKNIYKTFFS